MFKKIVFSALLVGLFVALPAVAQDEGPPTLARHYELTATAGHGAELEAALKQQVEWYEQNGETWIWNAWQWNTGPRAGNFAFRSPGHHWKDLDDRAERTARASANFRGNAGEHLASMEGMISSVMPDVSSWPDGDGTPAMVSVTTFTLHYGMEEVFVHTIDKIHEAIQETEWPASYAWVAAVSGGELPTFVLVIPYDSWEDMQGPEQSFDAMLEEAMGRVEADAIKRSLMKCVRELHNAIARHRPDLSYAPSSD